MKSKSKKQTAEENAKTSAEIEVDKWLAEGFDGTILDGGGLNEDGAYLQTWGIMSDEQKLLTGAELAYWGLMNDAQLLMRGMKVGEGYNEVDIGRWRPGGWYHTMAKRAASLAKSIAWEHPNYRDPLATLQEDMEDFVRAADGHASSLAMFCYVKGFVKKQVVAVLRGDVNLVCEMMKAKGAAEVARLRADLAKVKGDKAGYRKWKRKEKADVERGRLLDVHALIYRAQMSVPQAAKQMGLSQRSVERLLEKARKMLGPAAPPLPKGRPKSVDVDRRVGIDEAQRRSICGGRRRGSGGDCEDGGAE